MVNVWELAGEMLFLWEEAKDRCLCLFRWHHLHYSIYQIPCCPQRGPHFLLTQHWVNDWLEISLKLHDSICKAGSNQYPATGHPSAERWLSPFSHRSSDSSSKLLPSPDSASPTYKWQMHWFPFVVVLSEVVWSKWRMREKFLFNFLTWKRKKPNLTKFPNTPTFQKQCM